MSEAVINASCGAGRAAPVAAPIIGVDEARPSGGGATSLGAWAAGASPAGRTTWERMILGRRIVPGGRHGYTGGRWPAARANGGGCGAWPRRWESARGRRSDMRLRDK